MRIVSLNARGGAVWEQLSAWVEQAAFDVLCLQEVTRRIAPSPDWLIYRDPYRRLDQRANLFGAHLHGLRDPNGKGDTPDRDTQAASLRRQIREFRNGNETVVIAGDFNLLPDSPTFDVLAAEGLIELVTTRGHSDTRTVLYPKAQRHANYCFVSDPDRVIAFDVPATPVMSDHRPMILDLTI